MKTLDNAMTTLPKERQNEVLTNAEKSIAKICNDDDLTNTFIALEQVFQAENGTPQADERDRLLALIEKYEQKYTLIEVPSLFAKIGENVDKFERIELDDKQNVWE